MKIQYRTQYSRNTVDTVVYSEFRGTVPVFTVIFYEFQNFDKSFKYLVFFLLLLGLSESLDGVKTLFSMDFGPGNY